MQTCVLSPESLVTRNSVKGQPGMLQVLYQRAEEAGKGTEGQRRCLEEKRRRRGKGRGHSGRGLSRGVMCTHEEDVSVSRTEASVVQSSLL